MAQGEETDGTPTAPDPADGNETDPDKDDSATPTDDAGDPQSGDLNAGALSQPTTTGTTLIPSDQSPGSAPGGARVGGTYSRKRPMAEPGK
jgi:hypothetical protein